MKRNTYNQQSHVSFQPQSIQPALNANQFAQPSPHSSSTTSNSSTSQWLNKAGNWISNKVQAAQNFVDSQGNAIVTDDILPVLRKSEPLKLTANSLSSQPLIGVIDSGFKSDQHGNQMVEAIRQVNPEATIWKGGGVGTGDWAESLVKFVDTAKVTGNSRAVANLSFDLTEVHPDSSVSTRSKLTGEEQSALAYAYDNDVLIVASSGNQGGQMSALGTASQQFDNVVTVGAATGHERAAYSNYGKGLDLVAEVGAGGTSMAAAKVTGTIANIWSANSGLSEHQVNQILASTATDLKTPGWDAETGVGLVNPQEAISLAKHTTPELQVFSGVQLIQQVHGSLGEATWENKDGAIASERVNWGLPSPIGDWARDRVSKTIRKVDNVTHRAVNSTRRTASRAIRKADNVKDRAVNTTRRTASRAIRKADNVKDRAVNTPRRTASKAIRKVDNVKDRAVATTKEAWKDTSEWAKRNRKTISEVGHTALDVAGMVPVVGSVADAANAGWYLAAGDYKNAALSATGMIPGLGEAAIASKLALKGGKLLKNSERAVQIGNKADKGLVKGGRAIEVATLPANVQGTGVEASEAYRQFSQGNYLHSGLALTQAALSAAGVRSSSRTVRSGTDEIANRAAQRRNGERPRGLERSDRPETTHSEAPVRAARLATDTYPDRASQQGVAPRQTRKLNSSPDSTRQKPTSEISDRSSGTATSQKSIHPKVTPVGHDSKTSSKTRTGYSTYADKGFSAPLEKTIATSDSKHANDELWLAGHPEHTIRPGETLWEIAERAYGDGRKWTSIRKSDGTPYTPSEVRRLLPGTTVHLQGNESKKTTPPREIGSTHSPINHLSKLNDLNQPPTPENTGGTPKSELEASPRSSKGETKPSQKQPAGGGPLSIHKPSDPNGGRPTSTDASRLLPDNATPEDVATLQKMLDQHPEVGNVPLRVGKEKALALVREFKDETFERSSNSNPFSRQLDLSDPSINVKIQPKSTKVLRNQPGTASGGENLPDITGRWLEGSVGLIPGQIARRMEGTNFKNFAEFRETFWKLVAQDPYLSVGWKPQNLKDMRQGKAPGAPSAGRTGGGANAVYQLDHSHDLQHGGELYDLDSIRIVTPLFHQESGTN